MAEFFIVALLLVLNGVFSMSEMAVVSARRTRLQQAAASGDTRAREALALGDSPTHFLSVIQIGITLVSVLSGAFGGAAFGRDLGSVLMRTLEMKPETANLVGTGVAVTIITYLSVIVGELVPKRLALKYPESIARLVARPMAFLARAAYPLVWFFSRSTELVLRLLGLDLGDKSVSVTHEEIKAMVEQGEQEGLLEKGEKTMVNRALSFGEKRVTSMMTHVRDIVWIDLDRPLEEQHAKIHSAPHSRYPVAHGSLERLVGTLHTKDMCCAGVDCPMDFAKLVRPPLFVPESATGLQILEHFKTTRVHMGFVVDEFGAILGLLTLDDILEAIVGELPSQGMQDEKAVEARDERSWFVDGALAVDYFREVFSLAELPGEESHLFHTVAGFALQQLGRVPRVGDGFTWGGFRFEIVDMDGNRIDKILLTRLGEGEGLRPVHPEERSRAHE